MTQLHDALGSAGMPFPLTAVQLREGDGTTVVDIADANGEIWIKGRNAVAGYWNRPESFDPGRIGVAAAFRVGFVSACGTDPTRNVVRPVASASGGGERRIARCVEPGLGRLVHRAVGLDRR